MSILIENIQVDELLKDYPKEIRIKIKSKIERFKDFSKREEIGLVMVQYIIFEELEKLKS